MYRIILFVAIINMYLYTCFRPLLEQREEPKKQHQQLLVNLVYSNKIKDIEDVKSVLIHASYYFNK